MHIKTQGLIEKVLTSVKIQFRNKSTKIQNTKLPLSNINPNNTA